jgi:aspartyl-tRNA(Asn)/glutamyl-tRNA(Gln) amidotransferase subunit B
MALADYFERAAAAAGNAKAASNWVMGELMRTMKDRGVGIEDVPMTPHALAELITLVERGEITGPVAKTVFERMYDTGRSARAIVDEEGLVRIADAAAIDRIVRDVLAGHAATVAEYRAGKTKTFGFLVGQVMKATAGKADPGHVNESVRRFLAEPAGEPR